MAFTLTRFCTAAAARYASYARLPVAAGIHVFS